MAEESNLGSELGRDNNEFPFSADRLRRPDPFPFCRRHGPVVQIHDGKYRLTRGPRSCKVYKVVVSLASLLTIHIFPSLVRAEKHTLNAGRLRYQHYDAFHCLWPCCPPCYLQHLDGRCFAHPTARRVLFWSRHVLHCRSGFLRTNKHGQSTGGRS